MLHYKQVFRNVSERRQSKCSGVLMKHRRKVKCEQVITLQMAQQLKTKNINVVPGQLFWCQCKAKYLLEKVWIDDQDKVLSVTVTDTEKLKSIGILLVNSHAFMKTTLKRDITESYKEQVDCLKIQSLILIIKMIWKRKWMTWLGCKRQCKKS